MFMRDPQQKKLLHRRRAGVAIAGCGEAEPKQVKKLNESP